MTLFRILSVLLIAGLLSGMALPLRARLGSWGAVQSAFRRQVTGAVHFVGEEGKPRRGMALAELRRTVFLITLALALVLAASAFIPVVVLGDHPSGVLLIIHVTVAPFFALSLCLAALLWAERMRLRRTDWEAAKKLLRRQNWARGDLSATIRRLGFWVVLLVSLPLLLSIVLGMFPLFGTDGEEFLISVHGYSGLVLISTALVIFYAGMMVSRNAHRNASKEERS
jgi:hypothetical protein